MNLTHRALMCLLVLSIAPAALASTARDLSNEALTATADAIVVGSVAGTQSVWIGRTLTTVATVVVTDRLKGGETAMTIVLPGGIDARRRVPVSVVYAGAPSLVRGEEVFLFLEDQRDATGGYTIAGFSQGKFSIVTDDTGARSVTRDLSRLDLQAGSRTARGGRAAKSLDEFRAEILRYLRGR